MFYNSQLQLSQTSVIEALSVNLHALFDCENVIDWNYNHNNCN